MGQIRHSIVTCMSDYRVGFELQIGFILHLKVVTTNKYNTIAHLPAPNVTLTTIQIKFSLPLLDVSWQRILTTSAYVLTVWHQLHRLSLLFTD
jgi:hypothetical protein